MNLVGRESERGLKGLERALGRPMFVFANQPFPYTPGKTEELKALELGGFSPDNSVVLNVRRSVFPGIGVNQYFFCKGYKYRLHSIGPGPDDAWVKLIGVDASKGV